MIVDYKEMLKGLRNESCYRELTEKESKQVRKLIEWHKNGRRSLICKIEDALNVILS